jgi:glycine oxidase
VRDVVVVGGGVIGLASAVSLRQAGVQVTLVDAGALLGGQASQAAAGILGPLAESGDDGPLTRLLWASLSRYPEWIAQVRAHAASDPELDLTGILRVADEPRLESLRRALVWGRRYDPQLAWRDPAPRDRWAGAVWSPHEGQIFGPHYLQALAEAAVALGAEVRRGEQVVRLWEHGGRLLGVETTAGRLAAGHVVLAAGAWSGIIWERPDAVFPVRGQVMGITATTRPFPYVLFGPGGYVAPKRDGLVIVGATEDRSGFDSSVTARGLVALTRRLAELAPELVTLPFRQAWAGLRPATADGLPILGPDPARPNLILATGHYRNGLLLSPITAEAVTAWVKGTAPDERLPWPAFSPERIPDSPDAAGSVPPAPSP